MNSQVQLEHLSDHLASFEININLIKQLKININLINQLEDHPSPFLPVLHISPRPAETATRGERHGAHGHLPYLAGAQGTAPGDHGERRGGGLGTWVPKWPGAMAWDDGISMGCVW